MGQIKPRARELWQALKDCAKFRQQISICFINQMCNVRNLRKVLEFRHRIFKCKQLKLLHAQDYFKCNDSSKIRSRGFSAYEDRLAAAPRTPVCPETLPIPVPIIRTGPSSAPLPSFPSELLQPYVSLAAQGPGRRPSLTLEGPASARDVRVPRAYAPRFPHPPGPIPRRPRGPAGPPRGYTAPAW